MHHGVDQQLTHGLQMLHAMHDRGEINLVAVTVSTEDPWSACYVDLLKRKVRLLSAMAANFGDSQMESARRA